MKFQETKERRREPWEGDEELWWFWFSPNQTHSIPVLQNCRVLHFYLNKLCSNSVKWNMVAIANYRRRRFFIVGISLETAKIYNLVFKIWLRFYFSLKHVISIPYKIGKSGHIISIISCFGEMWCLKKECGFKETLYCTVCRKWFWEMRRIWGLLNEFIKITLPFAPKRWTWETDSIWDRKSVV